MTDPTVEGSEFRDNAANRRRAFYWGIAYFLLALMVFGGHLYSGDAEAYFLVAYKLLTLQAPVMPDFLTGFAAPGPDGALYAKFGLGLSLQLIPLLLTQVLLSVVMAAPPLSGQTMRAAVLLVGPLVGGAGTVLFHRLQYRLGVEPTARAVGTAFLVVPGLWLVYSRFLFSELSVAVCVLVVLYGLTFSSRRGDWLVGLGSGWALLLRVDALALVLPVLAVRGYRRGRWRPLGFPVLGAALIVGFYNAARYGTPFYSGMGHSAVETFSTPLWKGLLGQFVAPGNGLFVYAPHLAVVLGVYGLSRWRRSDGPGLYGWAFLAGLAVYLGVHSTWHSWMGGWSWGPRRLVPLMGVLGLAVPLAWRRMSPRVKRYTVYLLGLSAFLNLGGLAADFNRYYRGTFYQVDVLFDPRYAQVVHQNVGLWTGRWPLDLFWWNLLPPLPALFLYGVLAAGVGLSLYGALTGVMSAPGDPEA